MKNLNNSIYIKDLTAPETFDPLRENVECDVSIVGAGFTGLSSAIELAEAGLNVIVLEKDYIGYGASGRNGGHLVQGWSSDFYKIKKDVSNWGAKDLWGDFDLLIGAYKNNLKILEVPVTYFDRTEGETKMTNVIANASRMFWIVVYSFYKLRLKD